MSDSKLEPPRARPKPPNAGKGRPKGSVNKIPADVRAMIQGALQDAGGRTYLAQQATANPTAFLALIGKIVPKEVMLDATVDVPRIVEVIAGGPRKD